MLCLAGRVTFEALTDRRAEGLRDLLFCLAKCSSEPPLAPAQCQCAAVTPRYLPAARLAAQEGDAPVQAQTGGTGVAGYDLLAAFPSRKTAAVDQASYVSSQPRVLALPAAVNK